MGEAREAGPGAKRDCLHMRARESSSHRPRRRHCPIPAPPGRRCFSTSPQNQSRYGRRGPNSRPTAARPRWRPVSPLPRSWVRLSAPRSLRNPANGRCRPGRFLGSGPSPSRETRPRAGPCRWRRKRLWTIPDPEPWWGSKSPQHRRTDRPHPGERSGIPSPPRPRRYR